MFLVKNNKSSFYQIVYFENGKRTTHSTKKKNRNEAEQYLGEFKFKFYNSLNEITNPIKKTSTQNTITLSAFMEEYLQYVKPAKSKKYVSSIRYAFNYLQNYSGDILLAQLDIKIIDKFIHSTFQRTQRGAHQYYRTLKAAFNKALEWEYISSNPFTKVKFPKLPKPYPIFISEDELLIILTNTKYQHLKDLFTVAFYTGLRLSEIINMKWNWINNEKKQITVKLSNEFQTKSKKERIIPMSNKVFEILTKRFNSNFHKTEDFVFYKIYNKKLYPDSISRQFKKVVIKSNLSKKIHFHSLRHSFASLLVQKGVSLYVVKELLGHEDLKTTQIYSHLQQENLSKAIALL